jgi:hypothetical protein
MENITQEHLNARNQRLESKNKRLTLILFGFLFIWAAALTFMFILGPRAGAADIGDKILKVRGLVVVDENGTERIWIGAPVPEPLILGKRMPRGGEVSGIILFDSEGNERSGYVTSDGYPNVFFTLDSLGTQQVLFMAEPQGTPALLLWNGENRFRLVVNEDMPELKINKGEEVLFEIPKVQRDEIEELP